MARMANSEPIPVLDSEENSIADNSFIRWALT